ncbi:hypothetical protein WMY93_006551 [Mugilogobius chulae]|uniref:Thioredoxin-like fold domain-containing protein n=1 Tax=Mugilogobius chulae TaxID=88201 RepID=A0AAW0PMV9_9GOBI
MVDLFVDRVLVKNNKDQDELDTEREIVNRLQNRILLLFFGSAACDRCQEFAPALCDFYKRLTDEFYVDRSAQLHGPVSGGPGKLPPRAAQKCLFLAYEDPYRRDLEVMFNIEEMPTVLVLRPDCSVLIPNAVGEILNLGTDCYKNWQEAAEIIDRNFMISDDISDKSMRSLTDPVRRLKYKVENKKKKKMKCGGWGRRKDAEADGGGDGGAESPW